MSRCEGDVEYLARDVNSSTHMKTSVDAACNCHNLLSSL